MKRRNATNRVDAALSYFAYILANSLPVKVMAVKQVILQKTMRNHNLAQDMNVILGSVK